MGLPFNLHIHLGRHTYAMMALNGGVDIKSTSSLLGHASTMVTEKVYATLLPNTIAEIDLGAMGFNANWEQPPFGYKASLR